MQSKANEQMAREFMERAFNQGDLTLIDEQLAADAVDHQEPTGVNFRAHLKQVITGMRTAFPDLHFEIHDMLSDGDIVAFRSTMTGTHLGPLRLGPGPVIPPSGRPVSVAHMHFLRVVDGQSQDLWHVWDRLGMLQQVGALPVPAQTT